MVEEEHVEDTVGYLHRWREDDAYILVCHLSVTLLGKENYLIGIGC